MRGIIMVAVLVSAGWAPHALSAQDLPTGTRIPVRFLHRVTAGGDTVGSRVVVQTMAAVTRSDCIAVPAFAALLGGVTESRGGGTMGKSGSLMLRFDTLVIADSSRPIAAVLDTLEFEPAGLIRDSGLVVAARRRGAMLGRRMLPGLALAVADVALVPVGLLAGLDLLRRGPGVRIVAGELGGVRLTQPFDPGPPSATCVHVRDDTLLGTVPALPRFVPRSTNRARRPGDPMNVIVIGAGAAVDSAFRAAGWVRAAPPTFGALRREIVEAVRNRPAIGAPVSTQFFEGRPQDLAYERGGLTARARHHVRLWLVDSLAMVWIGAANMDVGLLVWHFAEPTHRIEADVDAERDRVATELEAGGCSDLVDYIQLPDALAAGRNASGQRFHTDRRTAVIAVGRCRSRP